MSPALGIRPQRDGERDAVRAVLISSFGGNLVADLADSLRNAPAGAHGVSLVAEDEGQVVGHVQLSRSWVDAPQQLVEVLVLSPLGVIPSHQRRGIGGQLVSAAMAEATRLGAPLVFLEGSPAYYRRFGFQRAGQRGFTAPSVRIPDPAFQVAILPAYETWMTGALVYAEQFWAFDCVGLRPPPA